MQNNPLNARKHKFPHLALTAIASLSFVAAGWAMSQNPLQEILQDLNPSPGALSSDIPTPIAQSGREMPQADRGARPRPNPTPRGQTPQKPPATPPATPPTTPPATPPTTPPATPPAQQTPPASQPQSPPTTAPSDDTPPPPPTAYPYVVNLNDGRTITCDVVDAGQTYNLVKKAGTITVQKSEVKSITPPLAPTTNPS